MCSPLQVFLKATGTDPILGQMTLSLNNPYFKPLHSIYQEPRDLFFDVGKWLSTGNAYRYHSLHERD